MERIVFKDINGEERELDTSKPFNVAFNCDCMNFLKSCPDKAFDLAVVDPPYGINADNFNNGAGAKTRIGEGSTAKKAKEKGRLNQGSGKLKNRLLNQSDCSWDAEPPSEEYFEELFRVSKNQIIWGGNYFHLPPTRGIAVWDKMQPWENFSQVELAWTSFDRPASLFKYCNSGYTSGTGVKKWHPCLPEEELVFINGEWKCIKDVRVGDKNEYGTVIAVSTHYADRLVEIEVDGEKTVATWNHPFLILRGKTVFWAEADKIEDGDELLCTTKAKQPLKGMFDTEKTRAESKEWNTILSGKNIMELFQKGCKSTTKTSIRKTITLRISSLSRPLNTNGFTAVASLKKAFGISHAKFVESSNRAQKNIGIFLADGSQEGYAKNAISRRSVKREKFESRTVGSVRIIEKRTKVFNLTMSDAPIFETKIGMSHNTQKPKALYDWLYRKYAKPGDKVLDTHLGSGTNRLAAYDAGLDFAGLEISTEYFEQEEAQFDDYTAQTNLFVDYQQEEF